jgi:hypothetical protein
METSYKRGRPQRGFRSTGGKKCSVFVNFAFCDVFRKDRFPEGSGGPWAGPGRPSLVRVARDKNVTPLAAAIEQNRHAGVCRASGTCISLAPQIANNRMAPMTTKTHHGSEHHETAAEHHESAAHHHREAAKHYDDGEHEKAGHHAHIAHAHGLHATHHAHEAAKQHAEHHGEPEAEGDE